MYRPTVADLMTADPVRVRKQSTIAQAVQRMRKHRIRHLPVVGGTNWVFGILSERDLLTEGYIGVRHGAPRAPADDADTRTVDQVMTAVVHTVDAIDPASKAATMMQINGYSALPVVEGKRLVGIITERDFVRWFVETDAGEHPADG